MERYKNLVIMELKIPWKGGWGRVWVVENEPEYLVKSFTVILKDKAFRSKFSLAEVSIQIPLCDKVWPPAVLIL
jgi:hypothetical protein